MAHQIADPDTLSPLDCSLVDEISIEASWYGQFREIDLMCAVHNMKRIL